MIENDGNNVVQQQNVISLPKWQGDSDDDVLLPLAKWMRLFIDDNGEECDLKVLAQKYKTEPPKTHLSDSKSQGCDRGRDFIIQTISETQDSKQERQEYVVNQNE